MNLVKLFFFRTKETIEVLYPIEKIKNHIEYSINRKTKSYKQKIIGKFISDSTFKAASYYSSNGFLLERTNAYFDGKLIIRDETKTVIEVGVKLNPVYGIAFISSLCISIVFMLNPQFPIHGIVFLIGCCPIALWSLFKK